jgi:hypothetical protein
MFIFATSNFTSSPQCAPPSLASVLPSLLNPPPFVPFQPWSPIVAWVCFIDGGYESKEFNDNISKDLVYWGKLGSHYGHGGNWRIAIQLFRQLDGKGMELKNTTPSSLPCMTLSC